MDAIYGHIYETATHVLDVFDKVNSSAVRICESEDKAQLNCIKLLYVFLTEYVHLVFTSLESGNSKNEVPMAVTGG
jgi:hypothetical protein